MKSKIVLTVVLSFLLFSACDEEGDKVTFNGGTEMQLTVSSSANLVLQKAQENFNSLQFQWTNPKFEFSNGVNTQNVTYALQIAKAGENFQGAKLVSLNYNQVLAANFKVKDLNNALSGLELADFTPHSFEFRVRASLGNTETVVYSNALAITISTYLDVVYPVPEKLFITGAATPKGWMSGGDAAVTTQQFQKVNSYTFVLNNLQINGSSGYLFVPVYGNWDNKYGFTGTKEQNNPLEDSFKPGGEDFRSPSTSKAYKITVNFKTGKYKFE
jgi:hypothetical protein